MSHCRPWLAKEVADLTRVFMGEMKGMPTFLGSSKAYLHACSLSLAQEEDEEGTEVADARATPPGVPLGDLQL